ncbi:MAG: T9SS type A sorting domain-containing protein [Bacteroidia bacterium]
MKKIVFITLTLIPFFALGQKRGSVWCFGDSALVDFSDTTNIITETSQIKWRGSSVSMSDSLGQLQFYACTGNQNPSQKLTRVFNSAHQLMQGGDSIEGRGWYRELVTIPMPGSDSLYYLFSLRVTSGQGIYYSIIDLSQNGGLGAVVQKNIQLQSFKVVDCLTAIKHGNGRDWWILFRRWDTPSPNSEIHSYLVTPTGILNYSVQNVGSTQSSGFGGFAVSTDGNKLAYINPQHLLELYDFDRCSGIISNPVTVYTESLQTPYEAYWGVDFSPSGDLLYVSKVPVISSDTARLYQFDLTSANIAASSDTLSETLFEESIGFLKLGLDNKIYLATSYYQVFPYNDTTYNNINMNLSVINSPDNLGTACDFQPYSFSLGGKRTYTGLPNNPDYHLGPKIGSGCDTLTSINEQSQQIIVSNLFPNPNNGEFTVNYFLPNGKSGTMEIFNSTGQQVYKLQLPRYTYMQNVSLKNLAWGVYLVKLVSRNKITYKKFIKQ